MIFLRFREIPLNEKSYNFLTNEYEVGVSVFELDNAMPKITNIQLLDSLITRLNERTFLVTGKPIAFGNDGEPLLRDVKIIKEIKINKKLYVNYIYFIIENNFQILHGVRMPINDNEEIRTFSNGKLFNFGGYWFAKPIEGFSDKMGPYANKFTIH